ncbi:MAG: TrkA family potassium uptake protein [Anaerolineales bacterium]|nr:TrkA family potassium uptake protein [Anaerolineales bacterium]
MRVMIAGGGRTGSHLAELLIAQGHDVRIVEDRPATIANLHRELPTEVIVEGDPTDPNVLEQAGIREAHVLAAVTPDDADNLVIAALGRIQFGVRRIIGRVNNPRNAWLFNQDFGIDVALNQADVMAKLIEEEMSLGDMMTLLKLRRGEYSIVEEKLPPQSPMFNAPLKDLPLPNECVIAAVIRKGKMLIPRGTMTFEEGDEVLAVVHNDSIDALKALFGSMPRARE